MNDEEKPSDDDEGHLPAEIILPLGGEKIFHAGSVYFLGDEMGEGYFGKVYACSDRWANELVAKVLLPKGRRYDEIEDQWHRELSNLRNLRHPAITYVYDAFEYRQTFYLIVERCAGGDLRQLLRTPGLRGELWLPALARDVLQAIDFMHRAGYVHKDVHPGNVFISWVRDRMVRNKAPIASFKVGDLGITRLEHEIDVFNTMLAQWMLPPEAVDPDQFGLIGRTVDIYHAALVFLTLLLGHVPEFSRDQILEGRPRQMAEVLPSVYGAPLARALRRHVAARPQSAAEFWEDIVRVMPPYHRPV